MPRDKLIIKKIALCTVVACMFVSLGCARKKDIVINTLYDDENGRTGLGRELEIPESCNVEIELKTKKIILKDDYIDIPDVDSVGVYSVKRNIIDKEKIENISANLFDTKNIYMREDEIYTKNEIEEMISAYNNNIETGEKSMVPYFQEEIKKLEKKLDDAPLNLPKINDFERTDITYVGERDDMEFELKFMSKSDYYSDEQSLVMEKDIHDSNKQYILFTPSNSEYKKMAKEKDANSMFVIEQSWFGGDAEGMENKTSIAENEIYNKSMDIASILGVKKVTMDYVEPCFCVYNTDSEPCFEMNGYKAFLTKEINGIKVYSEEVNKLSNLQMTYDTLYNEYVSLKFVDDKLFSVEACINTDESSFEGEVVSLLSWTELVASIGTAADLFYEAYPSGYSEIVFNDISLRYLLTKNADQETFSYRPAWVLKSYTESIGAEHSRDILEHMIFIDAVTGLYIIP